MTDNWLDIHDNFVTLLETTLSGSDGGYKESEKIDLTKKDAVPASIFDRSYSIVNQSMPTPWRYINGVVDMQYNVRLIVCYEINLQDSKASYNVATSAVSTIIKTRLPQSTWGTSSITLIEHKNTGQLLPISGHSQGSFMYITIDFQVAARDTLFS